VLQDDDDQRDVFERREVHRHLPRDVHRADVEAVDHHVGGGCQEGGGGHREWQRPRADAAAGGRWWTCACYSSEWGSRLRRRAFVTPFKFIAESRAFGVCNHNSVHSADSITVQIQIKTVILKINLFLQ